MEKFRKHIALALVVLFAFPIWFQLVHSFEHSGVGRLSDDGCEHDCTHHEETSTENFDAESKHCAICEYEFAIFEKPYFREVGFSKTINFEILLFSTPAHVASDIQSVPSLRAPPSPVYS
nr:hypothetical protein [Sunxiuqinia sp.]